MNTEGDNADDCRVKRLPLVLWFKPEDNLGNNGLRVEATTNNAGMIVDDGSFFETLSTLSTNVTGSLEYRKSARNGWVMASCAVIRSPGFMARQRIKKSTSSESPLLPSSRAIVARGPTGTGDPRVFRAPREIPRFPREPGTGDRGNRGS